MFPKWDTCIRIRNIEDSRAKDVVKFASEVLTFSRDITRTRKRREKSLMRRVGCTVATLDCGLCRVSFRLLIERRTSLSFLKEVSLVAESLLSILLMLFILRSAFHFIEYVAPEKIENILIGSGLIGQCFVYGDSFQHCLVAIVVPDEEPVKAWAQQQEGLSELSFHDLCDTPQLKDAIMVDIEKLSTVGGLHGFEIPKDIYLDSELFTVENDLVTPTFKLKRQKLRDHYQKQISDMYDRIPLTSKL
jgi:hypothetical protein